MNTDDEREGLVINYCPEHGDLLDGPRSIRCNEAHTVEDIRRTVQGEPRITIEHEGGNTVTGTPEQVLNHGHLKPGWKYRGSEPQGEPSDARVKAFTDAEWEHRFMVFHGGWSCKCGWSLPGPKLTLDAAEKEHRGHQIRASLKATLGMRVIRDALRAARDA